MTGDHAPPQAAASGADTRRKKRLADFRLIFAGAVGTLAVAELVLRFGLGLGDPPLVERDPQIEYQLLPDRSYSRFGNDIAINSLRMRSPEFAAEKATGEFRAILVGDSVVYGNHRLSQRDTIGYVLQSELSRSSNCRVTVGAIAASSWGPANQLAFIDRNGLFDADAVVFIQSSHDLADTPGRGSDLIPYRQRSAFGAVGDFAEIVIERLARRLRPSEPGAPYEQRVAASLAAFEKMMGLAEQADAARIFLFHPERSELGAPTAAAQTAFALFSEIADGRGAEIIDGRTAYAATTASGAAVHADEIHPGREGAATIAAVLAEALGPMLATRCRQPSSGDDRSGPALAPLG